MDLVSIIIPNYNRENLVVETVQNMLDQDYPAKEVIVVDDGSTDRSLERLQEFGDTITVATQKNQGPGAARNHGLEIAKGKYIQFMDSDDLASRNKISSQVTRLQQANADAVYSPWAKFDIDARSIKISSPVLQTEGIPQESLFLSLLQGWSTVLQTLLFKRELLDEIGPFKTDVSYLEDIDYLVRVILKSAEIAFESSPIIIYRNNSTEKLSAAGADNIKRSKAEAVFFDAFISHLKLSVPDQYRQLERRFAYKAAEVFHHLEHLPEFLESLENLKHLRTKLPGKWALKIDKKLGQYRNGVRQRIRGHRYNRHFRPNSLSEHHRSLILDLGFKTIETSSS